MNGHEWDGNGWAPVPPMVEVVGGTDRDEILLRVTGVRPEVFAAALRAVLGGAASGR